MSATKWPATISPNVRAWLDTQELAARDLWLFIEARKPTTDDDVVAATAAYLEDLHAAMGSLRRAAIDAGRPA